MSPSTQQQSSIDSLIKSAQIICLLFGFALGSAVHFSNLLPSLRILRGMDLNVTDALKHDHVYFLQTYTVVWSLAAISLGGLMLVGFQHCMSRILTQAIQGIISAANGKSKNTTPKQEDLACFAAENYLIGGAILGMFVGGALTFVFLSVNPGPCGLGSIMILAIDACVVKVFALDPMATIEDKTSDSKEGDEGSETDDESQDGEQDDSNVYTRLV